MSPDHAHSHDFDHGNRAAERGTWIVMWISLAAMGVELAAGWWYRSMALLADGWHMGSHAVAIGLSAVAYSAARRMSADRHFAFGSWKIEVLAGYTSAVFLLGVAGLMVVASVERLVFPTDIHYPEALAVAVAGLLVNLLCAWILGRAGHPHGHGNHHKHGHHNGHGHGHGHGHEPGTADQTPHSGSGDGHRHGYHGAHRSHHGQHPHGPHSPDGDLNLHAAHIHVVADAATSVLAIGALGGGWWLGWRWLDPVMALVGAALVTRWAVGLLREGGRILLDREMDHPMVHEIRALVARLPGAEYIAVTDLHVWRVGRHQFACILRLTTPDTTLTSLAVRSHLAHYPALVHATVEINHGPSA